MTTWDDVRTARRQIEEALRVDCVLLERQGCDPWDVMKALEATGNRWREEIDGLGGGI